MIYKIITVLLYLTCYLHRTEGSADRRWAQLVSHVFCMISKLGGACGGAYGPNQLKL
jgi:hypothetical protein